ncbi:decaprenyl-phosphate phosphoribosyltransferase [Legionella geestiana]|nr:decaprenyl-phosphate phosphoribosyltransferase [Legionella geestiana]
MFGIRKLASKKWSAILALMRPQQWIKSVFVLPGMVYAGMPRDLLLPAVGACVAFALVSSAVYIMNDVRDLKDDCLHPRKKSRPLALGLVTVRHAVCLVLFTLFAGLVAAVAVSSTLFYLLLAYLGLSAMYNNGLRQVPVLDVVCIACGFMLRVLAGSIGIGLPVSRWLLITTTLLSLCIALSKRLLEKVLYKDTAARSVLASYTQKGLDRAVLITGLMSYLSFVAYTLRVHTEAVVFYLPLLPAAFGLYRFITILHQHPLTDDPMLVFLHDRASCLNALFFIALTLIAAGG